MPLSPVKSRHEGNWLHFTIPSGGEKRRESPALSWKAMTFPARPLFLSALPVAAALVPVRPIWSVSPAELLGLMDGG